MSRPAGPRGAARGERRRGGLACRASQGGPGRRGLVGLPGWGGDQQVHAQTLAGGGDDLEPATDPPGPPVHGLQPLAAIDRLGKTAAIIGDAEQQARAVGRLATRQLDPPRARMLERVGDRLLGNPQGFQHGFGPEHGLGRIGIHPPVDLDAGLLQLRLEAPAKRAEREAEAVAGGVEAVDDEAQVVQRVLQRLLHGRRRGHASAHLDEQRDKVAANPVMHVAHEPLAFLDQGAFAGDVLLAGKRRFELAFLPGEAVFEDVGMGNSD